MTTSIKRAIFKTSALARSVEITKVRDAITEGVSG
jgi:hypothetical protein